MLNPQEVLDHDFLENRCMLLEIAATLDRYDAAAARSGTPTQPDPRLEKLYQSLRILAESREEADRTERLLRLFSLDA